MVDLLCRLTFIKASEKGHAMPDIKHGLMSGEELVVEYSTNHAKTNVFFVLDNIPGNLQTVVNKV